jgi:hypothetical protein
VHPVPNCIRPTAESQGFGCPNGDNGEINRWDDNRTALHDEVSIDQNERNREITEEVPPTIPDSQDETTRPSTAITIADDDQENINCCRITTVGEAKIDPPFACMCYPTTQVSELVAAEMP